MKEIKSILFALLAGYLATTSCTETRDPSKDIVYKFDTEFFFPDNTYSGKNTVLNMKIYSNVYRDEVLEHEGVYTDDRKSFLISPKGDTIKPGEKFNIPHIDKLSSFDFYSEDLGEHNLKFTFKNSKGFVDPKEHKLLVEKAPFKLKIKQSAQEITIDTPLEIEYIIDPYDKLKHDYMLKFEELDQDGEDNHTGSLKISSKNLENAIRNITRDESERKIEISLGNWYKIKELSEKLIFIPKTIGIHNLKISAEDDAGIKKTVFFNVESTSMGKPIIRSFSIDELRVAGEMVKGGVIDHKISILRWKLDAHSGNNKPFVKGKFTMKDLGGIEHYFEIKNPIEQDLHYDYLITNYGLSENFYVREGNSINYELELENSDGAKIVKQGNIIPKLDYRDYRRKGRDINRGGHNSGGGFRR